MDESEKKFKREFEKLYPGTKLKLRPEEKNRRFIKRLKFGFHGFGWSLLCGILSGAPLWILLIFPLLIGLIGFYGISESYVAKD